jgi:hypothetical protein
MKGRSGHLGVGLKLRPTRPNADTCSLRDLTFPNFPIRRGARVVRNDSSYGHKIDAKKWKKDDWKHSLMA